jgi:hypothetical protein
MVMLLLVFILGSNGLRDALPQGVAEGIAVLGGVGSLKRAPHSVAPALAVVAVLELRLYPRLCPLELVALLRLLGQLGLEGVNSQQLVDLILDPSTELLPVNTLGKASQLLFWWDDLGFDPEFL